MEAVVMVTRDEHAPVFVGGPYTVTEIPENSGEGTRVFALTARDDDQQVVAELCTSPYIS